jgi:hypothetical protein
MVEQLLAANLVSKLVSDNQPQDVKTEYSPYIPYEGKMYLAHHECRLPVESVLTSYEPKIIKYSLVEMLLHYFAQVAIEQKQPTPLRFYAYRDGDEFSTTENKQEGYYGDFLVCPSPGVYLLEHRDRKLLLKISPDTRNSIKELFFVQIHWLRKVDSEPTMAERKEWFGALANDARQLYISSHSVAATDKKGLHVFHFTSTMWERVKSIPPRSWKSVFVPQDDKKKVIDNLTKFLSADHQRFLEEKESSRKFSCLVIGERGTGKKSFIHAILNHFNLHKGVLDTGEIDAELLCVSSLPNNTAIVISNIEEIEEENTPALQNLLDGRDVAKGIVVFLTCRDLSKLSEPTQQILLTAARIDRTVTLKSPKEMQIRSMFEHFFPEQKTIADAFLKRIKAIGLPNLSILEAWLKKLSEAKDTCTPESLELLEAMIKTHKRYITPGHQQSMNS